MHAFHLDQRLSGNASARYGCPTHKVEIVVTLFHLDHFEIFSRTPVTHISRPESIDSIEPGKRDAELEEMRFLRKLHRLRGHFIRSGCLEVSTQKVDAICGLEHPAKLMEPCSFLTLCNVFRRFVPSFASVAAQLSKKLRNVHLLNFDKLPYDKIIALETLRDKLVKSPVLTSFRR